MLKNHMVEMVEVGPRDGLQNEATIISTADKLELKRFTAAIRTLRAEVDVVIVQVQSGTEDTHTPSPRSIKALRAAGATADMRGTS